MTNVSETDKKLMEMDRGTNPETKRSAQAARPIDDESSSFDEQPKKKSKIAKFIDDQAHASDNEDPDEYEKPMSQSDLDFIASEEEETDLSLYRSQENKDKARLLARISRSKEKAPPKKKYKKASSPKVSVDLSCDSEDETPVLQSPVQMMFGTAFTKRVADNIISLCGNEQRAAQIMSALPQRALATSIAKTCIVLARSSLVDEVLGYSAKSSSSTKERDVANTIGSCIKAADELRGEVVKSRMSQMCGPKTQPPSPYYMQRLPLMIMLANDALLNCAVDGEQTAACASCIVPFAKERYEDSIRAMQYMGLLPKRVLDPGVMVPWRAAVTRFSIWEGTPLETGAADYGTVPATPDSPEYDPIATVDPVVECRSVLHLKRNCSNEMSCFGKNLVLVPNAEMVSLIAAMRKEILNPRSIADFFIALRDVSIRPKGSDVEKIPKMASMFSALSDVSEPSKKDKDEHSLIIRQRAKLLKYYLSDNSEVCETHGLYEHEFEIAHVLFGFLRADPSIRKACGGLPMIHRSKSTAVPTMQASSTCTGVVEETILSINELPAGVFLRISPRAKSLIDHLWTRYCAAIGFEPVDHEDPNAAFLSLRDKYAKKNKSLIVHYWDEDFFPTAQQQRTYRLAMIPVIFALFPPAPVCSIPSTK